MCPAGVEFRDFQAPQSLRLVSHMLREHYQAADALASFGADRRTEQQFAHSKLGSAFAQRHLQLPSKLSAGSVFCMGPPLAAIGRFEAAPTISRKPTMTNCCLSGWNMAIIDIAIDWYLPVRPRRQYLSIAYSVVTIFHPEKQQLAFAECDGLAFGLGAAFLGFNRIIRLPTFIVAVARRWLAKNSKTSFGLL